LPSANVCQNDGLIAIIYSPYNLNWLRIKETDHMYYFRMVREIGSQFSELQMKMDGSIPLYLFLYDSNINISVICTGQYLDTNC